MRGIVSWLVVVKVVQRQVQLYHLSKKAMKEGLFMLESGDKMISGQVLIQMHLPSDLQHAQHTTTRTNNCTSDNWAGRADAYRHMTVNHYSAVLYVLRAVLSLR